jgi:RNA:NAD 2'-phosphotransferase (TPT1/KptA family)
MRAWHLQARMEGHSLRRRAAANEAHARALCCWAAAAAGPVISGIRSTCELLIYADVAAAMAQGIAFYRSANGVILVDSLPVVFFLRVEDLTQGGALLFLNGNPVS